MNYFELLMETTVLVTVIFMFADFITLWFYGRFYIYENNLVIRAAETILIGASMFYQGFKFKKEVLR